MEIVSDQQLWGMPARRKEPGEEPCALSLATLLAEHCALLTAALKRLPTQIESLAELAVRLAHALQHGRKVLIAGNGGSAAEAQHFAAELVGRFKRERAPYPVMALTTDTAILTAVANDYGYHDVFARQVLAFGRADDLLIGFSTSGESENVLRAFQAGCEMGMFCAAIVGRRQCRLAGLADLSIQAPAMDTSAIQEIHMVIIHLLCDIVEAHLVEVERQACL